MGDAPRADEGPSLDVSWRAVVVSGAVISTLICAFGLAIWVFGSPSGPASGTPRASETSGAVTTAPASTAPTLKPSDHGKHHHKVSAPLQPVKIHRDPNCPITPPVLLRVLQFNIHAGVSRYGGVGLARIAAEIRAAKPDIVSLNEVDSGTIRSGHTDEPAYLSRAIGMHAVYGPNISYDGGRFGNAILSRFPIVATHNTRLPRIGHSEARGLLEAQLRLDHRTIAFYSVHLSQGHLGGESSRVRQAEAVARIIQSSSLPTVVSGDLNSRPTDLPVRILRQYLLDAQQYGGTGPGLTVPEADPQNRIDYILYDNHFAPLPGSTQVLPSGSSDHRSVFTELVLRPKGQC